MPTNFTVVPVEDSPLSEQDNDDQILQEEDKEGPDTAAEHFSRENFTLEVNFRKVGKVCLSMPTERQNCLSF